MLPNNFDWKLQNQSKSFSATTALQLLAPAEGLLPEAATGAASGKTAPAAALFKVLLFPLYIRKYL